VILASAALSQHTRATDDDDDDDRAHIMTNWQQPTKGHENVKNKDDNEEMIMEVI